MKYHIFKVKPSIGREYYLVNNQYVGYVGCDSSSKNTIRSIIENAANITRIYQHFAFSETDVRNDNELHRTFCDGIRLTERQAMKLAIKFKFKLANDPAWYEVYFPDKNSSESHLREIQTKTNELRTIK